MGASVTNTDPAIHASAIVADGATLGKGCRIGPYCVVGPDVMLANNVVLDSHIAIAGKTSIGEGTRIWPFASIGSEPQDLKFDGEQTRLEIGARNNIREYATINPGTAGGGGLTRVGDDNLIMMHVHIAHDCVIGNGIVLANTVQVAGHVQIGDGSVLGGQSGVHQFVRIGRGAMIGAGAVVVNDVIPYGSVISPRGTLGGLNLIGLKRKGAQKSDMNALRRAYKQLFDKNAVLQDRAREMADQVPKTALVQDLLDFVLSNSDRSFCTPD